MYGVPRLVESKRQLNIGKTGSARITKISRPLRKHVRFEYEQKKAETIKVVFRGGFIRQNIVNNYFTDVDKVPSNWEPVTVKFKDPDCYKKMEKSVQNQIQPGNPNVRTYWRMGKIQEGSAFTISIDEAGFDCGPTFDDTYFYFNVISTIVESGSFGEIERGARNKAKIIKAMRADDASGRYRWCHFITSSEMKGIFDFFLRDYDYCANDVTIFRKIRAGVRPDPFKHHESRIRSHMLGYISGKSCKQTAPKLSGKRRVFSEYMYNLIMSYKDCERPYNTTKDISIMELKYMFENLSDLLEKYYWVDPATAPKEGYEMLNPGLHSTI